MAQAGHIHPLQLLFTAEQGTQIAARVSFPVTAYHCTPIAEVPIWETPSQVARKDKTRSSFQTQKVDSKVFAGGCRRA